MAESALVHLVDDDAAVRRALGLLLRSAGHRVTPHESGQALLDALPGLERGVRACVLTDVRMPGLDGIEAMRRLRVQGVTWPVVVMTAHGDVTTAVRAMKAGAVDFVEKPFDDDVILAAIDSALDGAAPPTQAVVPFAAAAARVAALSPREREVLDLLVAGRSNKVIAYELDISERTVEVHRARMMERLGVRSLSQAVRLAVWAELAGGAAPPADG